MNIKIIGSSIIAGLVSAVLLIAPVSAADVFVSYEADTIFIDHYDIDDVLFESGTDAIPAKASSDNLFLTSTRDGPAYSAWASVDYEVIDQMVLEAPDLSLIW